MQISIFFAVVLTVFTFGWTITLTSAEKERILCPKYEEIKCMDKPIIINKDFETNGLLCREEMKKEKLENKKERKRGAVCREVCKFQRSGIFNPNGSPNKLKYEDIMVTIIPKEEQEKMRISSKICFDKFGDLKFNATDIGCKGYEGFLRCVWKAFSSVCDEDHDEIDWE